MLLQPEKLRSQAYATSFYKLSMPRIWPKSNLGSNQRIPNCGCTYLLVSAPGDILNKTWLVGENDKDWGDDKSSYSFRMRDHELFERKITQILH